MRLLALLLVALAGCATLKNDSTVCPEYRNLRCVAGESCSYDGARGCRVCQCNNMDAKPGDPPAGIAPGDPSQPR
jgi:hypothetical protein